MKVMVLVKATKSSEAGEMPSQQLLTDMGNFNEELIKHGIMLAGEGLHPSVKGKRVRFSGANRTVVDGPFVETKELVAGFWMWKVKSMEEAVEWVKRCPNPHMEDCEIEIRPVFEAEDFGAEFTPELREQEAKGRAHVLGLESPRFENGREMTIAGLNQCYQFAERMKIPAQWERFIPHVGKIPGQVDQVTYGVSWNQQRDCGFDYLTGVEVTSTEKLPAEFTHVKLAARRYVVFPHRRHISEIGSTFEKIWAQWVPEAGLPIATDAPTFERYTEEFSDEGSGIEIWIPLQDA